MGWTEYLLIEAICRHTRKHVLEDEDKAARLKKESLAALETVRKRVMGYLGDYIAFGLVVMVLYKKSCMIEKASTLAELKEIIKPSAPDYSCGRFREGPYHVLEEEIILWSGISFQAPLNSAGYNRYIELFSMFFPEESAEILGKVNG